MKTIANPFANPFAKPIAAVILSLLIVAFSPPLSADDWKRADFKVKAVKGAVITIDYPEYWGKPEFRSAQAISVIQFGPFGPRKKPVFSVSIQAVPLTEQVTVKMLTETTKQEVEQLSPVAFETDIPITSGEGPNGPYQYFSISDKEKKWGEFDYVTMALVGTGNLISKVGFYSSDGAPDFAADAIQFIESIRYTQPPPKEEKKDEDEADEKS